MSNPYRSFTLVLAGFVIIFGVVLSSVAYFLISDQMIKETGDLTQAAMERHFASLTPLNQIFDVTASGAQDMNDMDSMSGMDGMIGMDDKESYHMNNSSFNQLSNLIHMHFDLYQIQDVQMIDLNGIIRFSYEQGVMNTHVDATDEQRFHHALQSGQMISQRIGSTLRLWIPVLGKSNAPIGVVVADRDMTAQKANAIRISTTMAILTAIGMFALFLGLRQLFVRTSGTIKRQTEELNELLLRIHRTYDESLQALSSALDSRDNETQGHSYRVTAFSWLLAKELGLNGEQLETLVRGAMLHDVGKIGIPDAILRKEGALDEMEWAIMRTHVNMGVRMLEHIDFLKPSLEVVRFHHERFDGKGYPSGLTGDQIPLAARVFAVCDTYDAMTSDRPYRSARSHEEAISELQRCSGKQFCPLCVGAFLALPREALDKVRRMSQQDVRSVSIEQFLPLVHVS